jgi:hypothetical protein
MSLPPGRPKEGSLPLGGKARSAKGAVTSSRAWIVGSLAALWLAGCATPPAAQPDEEYEPAMEAPVYTPMVEYPPIEPVEPPPVVPEPVAPPGTSEAAPTTASIAPSPTVIPPPAELSAEEQQMNLLLADLQRYGNLQNDDARRELATMTQILTKQRTDANRVRLAMLYTVARTNPQDDQRALQLLDNVAKSGAGSPAVKQLAAVLQTQVSERVRAVKDEQQKADAAIQKLEALRNMERSLLRERVRGGGGGGGGAGGSSGGGGGGSSGGSGH